MSKTIGWMRSKEKLVIAIILVVVMVAWVLGPALGSFFEPKRLPDGRIFGKRVSGAKVRRLAKVLTWLYGPQIRQERSIPHAVAWDTLIMVEEAKRYGITAGPSDVIAALERRFAPEGGSGIDEAAYAATLRELGVGREEFEAALGSVIVAQKVQVSVMQSATLTTEEAWLWHSREKKEVKAAYVAIEAAKMAPLARVTAQELKVFYEKYADTDRRRVGRAGYLQPENIKIEYIMAPHDTYQNEAVVTERQVRSYYEDNKARYKIPAPKPAEPKKDGETTADAELPRYKPLAQEAGEIEKKLRLEEAKQIADEVMKEVDAEVWRTIETPFGAEQRGSADLKALAEKYGLVCRETDFFGVREAVKILPGAWDLQQRGFGQPTNSVGMPRRITTADEGPFIFQLLAIRPPKRAPYEDVKEQVEEDLRMEKGMDLAVAIAGKARAAEGGLDGAAKLVEVEIGALVKGLAGDSELAKDPKAYFTTGSSKFFDRPREYRAHRLHSGTGLPGGDHGQFAAAAFELNEGEVGVAIEEEGAMGRATPGQRPRGAVFLLVRTGVKAADRKEFEESRDAIKRRLLDRKRTAVGESWRADLRRRAQPSEEAMTFLKLLPTWSGQKF